MKKWIIAYENTLPVVAGNLSNSWAFENLNIAQGGLDLDEPAKLSI